jgi:competence protein ComEA
MPDRPAASGAAGEPAPAAVDDPPSGLPVRERVLAVWHRVRSGEDPLAFGAVVVVIALAVGLLWFWAGSHHGGVASAAPGPSASDAASQPPTPPAERLTTTTGAALAVHVAGAVVHPGLYHLPPGSRVADALAAAGGSVPRADLDRLNLAARLVDGQRVGVVRRGQPIPVGFAGAGTDGDGGGTGSADPGSGEPIDLNAAGLAALDSLPGVGPATARAILEERVRRGGFRSTRDLLRVPGIGEGRFARLKDHVRV